MEVRTMVAYGLIAIIAVAATNMLVVWRRRRTAHRLRMAGIKTPDGAAPPLRRR